ncbi:hypothetical protein IAQ61_008681 [Plenodomus lingam]|uniref:uncharacterized protein n=1 Tax=Leptosphaeria maculans TaxID=5022 RepID=UPI00331BBB05|nr:hypothetical protein IAQ61_008681 [Plenodomus lingam]
MRCWRLATGVWCLVFGTGYASRVQAKRKDFFNPVLVVSQVEKARARPVPVRWSACCSVWVGRQDEADLQAERPGCRAFTTTSIVLPLQALAVGIRSRRHEF